MSEKKEVKTGIARAVDILKAERNRIQHVIDLLEGNAEVPKVDDDQPEDVPQRRKKQKPEKSPPAKMKRSYIPYHKHIRAVLEESDIPLTPFKICRLLLDKFNIMATEAALKKILKADAGLKFYEVEDGQWGLVA